MGHRMIVDLGPRAVSVTSDEPTAVFQATAMRTVELIPKREHSETRRALVELRRFQGGLAPHALLGGEYVPGGEVVVIRVGEGHPDGRRTCRVKLGGRKMIPGLPSDLMESALGGLARTLELAAGVVSIDRAAFDPVDTSPLAVELTAELLGRALSLGAAPSEAQLRSWLDALP